MSRQASTTKSANGLTTEVIAVADLPRLAADAAADADAYPVIPIPQQRAEAQSRNPQAQPGDAGIVLARQHGRCVGYLGLMPQRVVVGTGNNRPIYSITALFLNPVLRGTGMASRMLNAATDLGRDVLTVGNSKAATRFFMKMGASALPTYSLTRIELPPGTWLGASAIFLKKVLRLAKQPHWQPAIDIATAYGQHAAGLLSGSFARALAKHVEDHALRPRTVEAFEDNVNYAGSPDATTTTWDTSTLNWMLRNPWCADGRSAPPARGERAYHFGTHVPGFKHYAEVWSPSDTSNDPGFGIFIRRMRGDQRTLSILQHKLPAGFSKRDLLARALVLAATAGADVILGATEFSKEAIDAGLGRLTSFEERVSFMWPQPNSPLTAAEHPFKEEFTDGDIAFY